MPLGSLPRLFKGFKGLVGVEVYEQEFDCAGSFW